MSKIGKMPITVKQGITVTLSGDRVSVKGTKGELHFSLPQGIAAVLQDDTLVVSQKDENDKTKRALYGLTRATLANMVKGVDTGFEKKLELSGVGYRAQMQGMDLVLSLGFSHPVKIKARPGTTLAVSENVITISGFDKSLVGELSAEIRAIKPPEPYKGKGIKYVGEYIRRKAGKAAKAVGTK